MFLLAEGDLQSKSKRYSSLKYGLSIFDTAYLLILLFIFLSSGVSRVLVEGIHSFIPQRQLVFPLYLLIIYIAYYILNFPLNFYHSFILEHNFSLSNQKVSDWLKDGLKSGIIIYVITLILFGAFYYILQLAPGSWWLIVSAVWIFFSLIMARLLPVIIIPIFFKYKALNDESLRQRIIALADRMKVKILDVFEIDFSRKTLKANAAFVGWGRTRRVLLADTLKDKYSHDEIEVILAHEFAHYRLRHIFKLILIDSLATIATFYLIFKSANFAIGLFALPSLQNIAAFPLILIYFVSAGIITRPLENYASRCLERDADALALKVSGLKDAFISMMEKLSAQNLADRSPAKIIKIFFFDHPPIDERIKFAQSFIN